MRRLLFALGICAGVVVASPRPAAAASTDFVQSPVLSKFVQDLRKPGPGGIPVAIPDGVRKFQFDRQECRDDRHDDGDISWHDSGNDQRGDEHNIRRALDALFGRDWSGRDGNEHDDDGEQRCDSRRCEKKREKVVADHYTIDINQFSDVLHPDLPATTLWGFNPRNALGVTGVPTQKHLGGIIIAERGRPIEITFRNNLPNAHILPVDTTIPGAAQAQNRTSVHLHGGLIPWISDGGPFAWFDPQGGKGESFLNNAVLRPHGKVPINEAEYYYPNDQSARMVWYHDHALGITRLNAYAGIASAYLIRDDFERSLVKHWGLPGFVENGGRELPIVLQDKIFQPVDDPTFPGTAKTKGSLWYPFFYDPTRWDVGPTGTPPPISVVPEMFGDTGLVNGSAYPTTTLDPRRYRLRILNASQARFYNLQIYEDDGTGHPNLAQRGPDFLVIGTEGGFLARPARVASNPLTILSVDPTTGDRSVDPAHPGGSLITAPGERWDLLLDFKGKSGKKYLLVNDAPAPFPAGDARNDYPNAAGQGDTTVLMRFVVGADSPSIPKDKPLLINPLITLAGQPDSGIDPPLAGTNPAAPAKSLDWSTIPAAPLPIPTRPGIVTRQLTLNEKFDSFGRLIQLLGTNVPGAPGDFSIPYEAPATETPNAEAVEVWQIANLTGDVHPIHFHLVNVQVLSRQPFDTVAYLATPVGQPATPILLGTARGPDPQELGWKETVKMNPGEVTTVIMKFSLPKVPFVVPTSPRTGGFEYVWHCHILEHEEHDMMRPLIVTPPKNRCE